MTRLPATNFGPSDLKWRWLDGGGLGPRQDNMCLSRLEPWGRNYDITPDGERFLMIMESEPTPAPTRFTVTLNWFEELKARVGNE